MALIYHAVPEQLEGPALRPLNALRSSNPDLYSKYLEKYRGREFVMQEKVFNLNCLWNDVLHFSPVHPTLVRKALADAGHKIKPRRWFVIDPERCGFTATNASIFKHSPRELGDNEGIESEFVPFSVNSLSEYCSIPEATIDYYQYCKQEGLSPLLFCWIPHVLFRGDIEIAALEIITA